MAKPVELTIEFKLPLGIQMDKVSLTPEGDLRFFAKDGTECVPEFMGRSLQYQRPKGPKIQTHRLLRSAHTTVAGLKELTRFESIHVIDTNTRTYGSRSLSVACFACFRLLAEGAQFRVQCEPRLNFYEFHDVRGSAELLAVLKLANDIRGSATRRASDRFAIVTDAHLGIHEHLNARTHVLYGIHRLPRRFQILYASSDTGQEILNRFLKFCDAQATQYFRLYEQEQLPPRTYRFLKEDASVRYAYVLRKDLEVVNPIVSGVRVAEGSTVSLYGRRAT